MSYTLDQLRGAWGAGHAAAMKKVTQEQHDNLNLVGKFFHSVDGKGGLRWQGTILSEPSPDMFLVQLFDWVMGQPSIQKLIPINEMNDWIFYSTHDEWVDAGDKHNCLFTELNA